MRIAAIAVIAVVLFMSAGGIYYAWEHFTVGLINQGAKSCKTEVEAAAQVLKDETAAKLKDLADQEQARADADRQTIADLRTESQTAHQAITALKITPPKAGGECLVPTDLMAIIQRNAPK